ncbi:MAG: hypothetical protein WCC17_00270 [Candidatus Nitrosopolaris sp.]
MSVTVSEGLLISDVGGQGGFPYTAGKLEERIGMLESRLNEIKNQPNTDAVSLAS